MQSIDHKYLIGPRQWCAGFGFVLLLDCATPSHEIFRLGRGHFLLGGQWGAQLELGFGKASSQKLNFFI